jgi:HK97 family phage prohead protease
MVMMETVTATRFKHLHRDRTRKNVGAPVNVQKIMESPAVEVSETERSLRFTISTGSVDRERDVINQNGWRLDEYKKNAVVLWAHDARALPVGQVKDIGLQDGKLMATVDFVQRDMPVAGEFAEAVFRMCKQGFLKATSVGFRPLKWDFTTDKARGADDWFPGIDFHEQELCELSIVTVPGNPEALIDPSSAGEPSPSPQSGGVDQDAARAASAAARERRRRVLAAVLASAG